MSNIIHMLEVNCESHWILKPYHYWLEYVAEDYVPSGVNSSWFIDWFFETYNLKWSYAKYVVTITAEREEDWIRFQLEWM